MTFNSNGDVVLEFKFNEFPQVSFENWIQIESTKQHLHFLHPILILYPEDITHEIVNINFTLTPLWWIQEKYRNKQKILLLSTLDGNPIMLFSGNNITSQKEYFQIDGKKILFINCNWTIITHKS